MLERLLKPFRTISVLGVDDNALQQLIYADYIPCWTMRGRITYKGATGYDSFNGLKVRDYDIVLLDFDFPGKSYDGEKVAEFLRDHKGCKGRIIFATYDRTRLEALRSEGKYCMQKPLHPELLRELIYHMADTVQEPHCKFKDILESVSNYEPPPLSLETIKRVW